MEFDFTPSAMQSQLSFKEVTDGMDALDISQKTVLLLLGKRWGVEKRAEVGRSGCQSRLGER